jgi:hypothetical protein
MMMVVLSVFVMMFVPMVLMPVLMVLMPMAVPARLFVMVVMVFVYHSSACFPKAKVHHPGCNRVAIVTGIGYLAIPKQESTCAKTPFGAFPAPFSSSLAS